MKSQKRRRLWPTSGCNAMEEEEEDISMLDMCLRSDKEEGINHTR
jgi:hypothetical protein